MNKLDETIQFSVSKGLMWLCKNQNQDGSFGDLYPITTTALALLAFEKHAQKQCILPLNPNYTFFNSVDKAFMYILENVKVDGDKIYFEDYGNTNMPTGCVLAALAASGCEDYLIAYNEYLPINGYTFNQLKQEIINYLTSSQNDDGGWGESTDPYNSCSSNVITGYVVLGLLMEKWHGSCLSKPIFNKLENWIEYIQNDNGGAGNYSPTDGVNVLNTGFLIEEMYFLNYPSSNNNLKWAKQYIADNWCMPCGYCKTGWNNHPVANYEATFAVTLGLSLYDVEYLKTSNSVCIYWYRDITRILLSQQSQDGSWPASKVNFEQSDPVLSSVWAMLTLEYIVACEI
ncbi:MAG: prenyltransferase/squalene oxidase repeat-containing protein [Romboutsia sp.]|uniref:prenyltransferase/squalene oxidase repeat-containing protein n=1 Tax=Romboutsia sp. TaxID=1965302 RepID=UPI003F2B1EEC